LLVKVLRSATISKLLIYRNTVEVKYKWYYRVIIQNYFIPHA
jgi:hypothetical protein